MADHRKTGQFTLSDFRSKVAWLFYGTRTFADLDSESQDTVDDIVNDGYQRFMVPPVSPGERAPHRWNFLRPYLVLKITAAVEDYTLPEDFGGLDGPLFYKRGDNRWFNIAKVDPNKILAQRQRDSLTTTSYPTEFAVVADYPDGSAEPSSKLMIWPTPDAAYDLSGRYFVIAAPLTDNHPYPVCPASHNQCLVEAILSVAEERLDDSQGIHGQNFLQRLQASVMMDKDQYSPDHLSVDIDRSDGLSRGVDYMQVGGYVSYNGYTPGS